MVGTHGAGPTDAELEAAVAWVWAQGGELNPLSSVSNHQCALAALLEWYLDTRDVMAAVLDYDGAIVNHNASLAALDVESGNPERTTKSIYPLIVRRDATYEAQYRALDTVLDALSARRHARLPKGKAGTRP